MRKCLLGVLLIAVGCGVFPTFSVPSADMTAVVGGLTDLRPYFGRARAGWLGSETGDFAVSSCGCGDWRALYRSDDGTRQTQLVVKFYSDGDYQANGSVALYGVTDGHVIMGTVDQDAGDANGLLQLHPDEFIFSVQRGTAHEQTVDACIMCHLGDNPVWPLPEQHPDRYKTNPRVCLECHSANGQ